MAPERPGLEDERCGGSVLLHANGVTVPIVRQPLTLASDLLKEGDGAVKVFTEVRVGSATTEDDDLTPLSWLQDRNLLKGIALRAGPMCPEGTGGGGEARRRVAVEEVGVRMGSPTSDYADDSSEQADSSSNSGAPASPPVPTMSLNSSPELPAQNSHPSIIPYNPKVHVTSKPPYSFSCLIFMAIEDCIQRALPVKDIYAWILDHFPYFQTAPTGWKNSVRHNLSLNKCFKKVDKSPNVGKGSLWMVDPVYRPNLLQALRKAPFHPYMQADRLNSTNGASSATTSSNMSNVSTSSSSSNSSEYSVPVLLTAATPSTPGRSNLPNPTLFPFLSRRLAAAGLGLPSPQPAVTSHPNLHQRDDEDSDSREDVDAATAMLALKHGPRILLPRRDEWYKRLRDEGTGPVPALDDTKTSKPRHRSSLTAQQVGSKSLVITSSPSEDHTYAGPTETSTTNNGTRLASSPDEAFGEGSFSSAESSHDKDEDNEEEEEEQRKIAEGADALLNLAGICTAGRGTKRGVNPLPRHNMKRQRLMPDRSKRQPPARTWKKASLHQGSRVHKGKSKEKTGRHRR